MLGKFKFILALYSLRAQKVLMFLMLEAQCDFSCAQESRDYIQFESLNAHRQFAILTLREHFYFLYIIFILIE